MKKITIAIDGGAGTGKGTTARGVAKRLGYAYVDTGAMYRAVTLWLLRHGLEHGSEQEIASHLGEIDIYFGRGEDEQKIFLNEENVTDAIRSPEVNEHVARLAAFPDIRIFLRAQQRAMATTGGVVMDGRDMGSVVVPDAELKVFLTCDLHERAQRRHLEMHEQGVEIPLTAVEKNLQERDQIDYTGKQPTSVKAIDARDLDTTYLTKEQQIDIVTTWAEELLK